MQQALVRIVIGCLMLALAACGGGGGGAPNRSPVANAGPARTADIGALVIFDGSASSDPDGNPINYLWALTSKPASSTATLSNPGSATPSLRADTAGTYAVSLLVSDGTLSSTATTTATIAVNATDQSAQAAAQLAATVDVSGNSVMLSWKDSFPSGSAYRVEMRNADGSFAALDTVAGLGGAGATITWQRVYTGDITFRITAITGAKELPIRTLSGDITLPIAVPAGLQVAFSNTEPVSGPVVLSASSAPAGSTVDWLVDLAALGSGASINWNTVAVANGSHLILARVSVASVVFELRRNVAVFNAAPPPTTTVSLVAHAMPPSVPSIPITISPGAVVVYVVASSNVGLAQVDVAMDSGAPRILTTPNACSMCGFGLRDYRFDYSATTLGSGNHVAVIRAVAADGTVRSLTLPVPVRNAPVIAFTPRAGKFVSGTLALAGTYTTDTAQPVTVTASLGALQFMSTTAQAFSGSLSLAGVTPGNYTLTVVAKDAFNATTTEQRQIVVALPERDLPSLFATDETGVLLAAAGDFVTYKRADGTVRVRDVVTSAEVTLADTGTSISEWVMTPDWVYHVGTPAGCSASACLLRWSTTNGAMTNLTNLDPTIASVPVGQVKARRPILKDQYVLWVNDLNNLQFLTLYNSTSGSFTRIDPVTPPPPDTTFDGDAITSHDIAVVGGAPTVFYFIGDINGFGGTNLLFRWTSASGTTFLARTMNGEGDQPVPLVFTDGARIAYSSFVNNVGPGGIIADGSIILQPVAGGALTTLDRPYDTSFVFHDGVAVWRQNVLNADVLRAWSAARGVETLTPTQDRFSPAIGNAGSSFGLYYKSGTGGLYSWNGATGASVLRADGGPYVTYITGNWVYFKTGAFVYRFALS